MLVRGQEGNICCEWLSIYLNFDFFWLRNKTEEGGKGACSPCMRFKAFTSLGKVFGLLGCCALSVCNLLPTLLDQHAVPGHQ